VQSTFFIKKKRDKNNFRRPLKRTYRKDNTNDRKGDAEEKHI
jgi:hypothetical protein